MSIRGKIILVVLPLIVTPLLFAGLIATLLARNGVTGVATQFLQFKVEQISTYANGQWQLLEDNALTDQPDFRAAAVDATASFARTVLRTPTELIFAVDASGTLAFVVGEEIDEQAVVSGAPSNVGWTRFELAGTQRVGYTLPFAPFDWAITVTERASSFYESTNSIIFQIGIVLAVSVVVGIVLLVLFAGYLTKPLRGMVDAMTRIIETNDLSQRVDVLYSDETGKLAHTFNLMTDQLERAYDHIKSYALRAATLRIKEQKTRTIFQKYVPPDVIDQFFTNPEGMLVGDDRIVSILFSDIRDFTTISEQMRPDQLVETLNRYFTIMVDAIMEHNGIVDKYIGDAIMALFGTPLKRDDDARQSALAALDMVDGLRDFNRWQEQRNMPPFRIGVGINYGVVTVGNIGTDKKLDYTVIGDMVNVASRLEELTKRYRTPVIVSESVKRKLDADVEHGAVTTRMLDTVQVKGRSEGLRVFAIARRLDSNEVEGWVRHTAAMKRFYERDFARARTEFAEVSRMLPQDIPARIMIKRCDDLIAHGPDADWNGILEMLDK